MYNVTILGGVGGWMGRESSDGSGQNTASGFVSDGG